MPLQIEVTGPVVTNAGERFHNKQVNSEFTLKCWLEGVDKQAVAPVIDMKLSYQQKTVVEGKTTDDLASRVESLAAVDMQKVIDQYNYAKGVEVKARVGQMAANIQGVLNG